MNQQIFEKLTKKPSSMKPGMNRHGKDAHKDYAIQDDKILHKYVFILW